jgi:hypothetical protein
MLCIEDAFLKGLQGKKGYNLSFAGYPQSYMVLTPGRDMVWALPIPYPLWGCRGIAATL